MDARTGRIVDYSELNKLCEPERNHFVEVKRDLTKLESANKQIKMYSPCGCGSGKKLKFCCHKKNNQRMAKEVEASL
jgi:uncharacterized protein YchJ